MAYFLGIDIGTTYTAAAIWRDGQVSVASLGQRGPVVPTVVFATEDGPLLIGYTQAEPRGRGTYYIANTAIAKSHQGRGLVKLLMQRLYDDMRAAGARFIERDAAIANGYADAVVRAHGPDIVETFDHDSEYGPQRFIRMRVPAA